VKPLRALLGKVFGEGFASRNIQPHLALVYGVIAKVTRINGTTPWPVHWTSTIKAPQKIDRGTRFPGLSKHCHIDGRNGIVFGKNVWIGPGAAVISMNHDVMNFHVYKDAPPVRIGDNCWLGANSLVLPGVELGPHTVVAAGAVVVKSFPEGDQVLAGNPARVVRSLPPYEGPTR